jgi:hypothetical protein
MPTNVCACQPTSKFALSEAIQAFVLSSTTQSAAAITLRLSTLARFSVLMHSPGHTLDEKRHVT